MGGFILNNNRGFTTIELILAILIAGIVMGAVGSFLTFNLRSFNTTTDIIDIQYEGQLVMNQLVEVLRESEGISDVTGFSIGFPLEVENKLDAAYEVVPTAFSFEHSSWNGTSEDITNYLIKYDATTKVISIESPPGSNDYVMGQYVSSFSLEPVDTDFEFADNIIIRMSMEQDGASLNLESQVKIRNKH